MAGPPSPEKPWVPVPARVSMVQSAAWVERVRRRREMRGRMVFLDRIYKI
jgi:hypothetical protein